VVSSQFMRYFAGSVPFCCFSRCVKHRKDSPAVICARGKELKINYYKKNVEQKFCTLTRRKRKIGKRESVTVWCNNTTENNRGKVENLDSHLASTRTTSYRDFGSIL